MSFMDRVLDRAEDFLLGRKKPESDGLPYSTYAEYIAFKARESHIHLSPPTLSTPTHSSESIEVVDTEILAWRGWRFDSKSELEPVLTSVGHSHVRWEGPVLTADAPPSTAINQWGQLQHAHGIYALKAFPEPEGVDAHYFSFGAYGQVALSGLVVEGERGYRAERAVIRSLYVGRSDMFGLIGERFCAWEIAGMLEHRYGVDVQLAPLDWSEWIHKMKCAQVERSASYRR